MSEDEKRRFEMRLMLARRVGEARWNEQKRIGDRIEQLLYEADTSQASEVLISLAHHVFGGAKG